MVLREHFLSPCNKSMGGHPGSAGSISGPASIRAEKSLSLMRKKLKEKILKDKFKKN